jgi:hypothetical protein
MADHWRERLTRSHLGRLKMFPEFKLVTKQRASIESDRHTEDRSARGMPAGRRCQEPLIAETHLPNCGESPSRNARTRAACGTCL